MTRDNLIVPILEGEEADNVVTPGKKWLLKLKLFCQNLLTSLKVCLLAPPSPSGQRLQVAKSSKNALILNFVNCRE